MDAATQPDEGTLAAAPRPGVAALAARLGAIRPERLPSAPAAGTGLPAGPPLDAVALPRPPRVRRKGLRAAMLLSLLLHGAALAAVLHWRTYNELGVLDRELEAISVEIVEARVLEALLAQSKPEPASAPAATAPVEGNAEEDAQPSAAPVEREAAAAAVPVVPDAADANTQVKNEEPEQTADSQALPVEGPLERQEPAKAEETKEAKVEEPPKTPVLERRADETSERAPQLKEAKAHEKEAEKAEDTPDTDRKTADRARKGGSTARAERGNGARASRASASTGAVLGYAARVRARVAANKPSGGRERGTAVVSFGLTASGGLAFANLARSSGSSKLDRLAVSAVRGAAPFPPPPEGASPAQLRFSIPFHFQ